MKTSLSSLRRLLTGVVRNRWMVVVATFFIMSTAGATYSFGLYSQKMKVTLHYSQRIVSTIGLFKDLGAKIGIISGLLYDVSGPWVVLSIGALLNTFGFLMIWLALTRRIAAPEVWQMCLYIAVGTNSQSFTNTGVVVTCVKNFPNNRGFLIGLIKGFVGLSGAILTMAYEAVYGTRDPANFVLLLTWLPPGVCIAFMFFVQRMTPSGEDEARSEKRISYVFLLISLLLAAYLMIITIVKNLNGVRIPRWATQTLAGFMLLIILLPLGVVLKQELQRLQRREEESPDPGDAEKQPELISGGDVELEHHCGGEAPAASNSKLPEASPSLMEQQERQCGGEANTELDASNAELLAEKPAPENPGWKEKLRSLLLDRPARGEDYTILEGIFSVDMLLIFVCTTCGFGTGLAVYDNLGQIGDSLGYSHPQVATFVSLLSIWNFLGRVAIGLISDIYLRRYQVPRPFFFALMLLVSTLGHVFLALNFNSALFLASIAIGFSYGAQLVLMYILVSEFFGLKYYGTLYNIGNMASPLGSYIFSLKISGDFYDREARRQHPGADSLLCHGAACYRLSFIISAATCVFGFFVACILTMRTRKFYKEMALKATS